jgi:TonB family protein
LSSELNRVAFSAQLQSSDVQWKTWGRSREAWSKGVAQYAQASQEEFLAVLKLETLAQKFPPLPANGLSADLANANGLYGQLLSRAQNEIPELKIESFIDVAQTYPSTSLRQQAAVELELKDETQFGGALSFLASNQSSSLDSISLPDDSPQATDSGLASKKAELTPLKSRPPNYPWQARRKGIEGFVKLEFSVDAEGKVRDVEVLDAMPEGVFEKAASKAISKWTFVENEHSTARFHQVFDFELQDLERGPPRSRPCALTGSRTCGIISPAVFVVWVNETTRDTDKNSVN